MLPAMVLEKSEEPSLRGVYLLTAILMMGIGAVFSLLGEIRDTFGFSETGIGLIGGMAFVAGFFAQLGVGKPVDLGYGQQVLRLGLAAAILGAIWMTIADTLWAWICARGLFGLGTGFARPAVRRLVLMRDPEHMGRSMGKLSSYEMGGFLLGPVVAAVLASWINMQVTFVVLTVLLILLVPVTYRTRIPGVPASRLAGIQIRLLSRPAMQACLSTGAAFYITVGVFEAIWAVYMVDLGASQMFIGLTMSLFAVPMVLITPWAGSFAQRKGPMNVTVISVSVAAGCMVFYGVLDSIWYLCIPLAVHSVADAFTMPANQLAVGQASGSDALATGQGLFGAVGMAVSAIAAILSGILYQHLGAGSLWVGAAATMCVCIVAAWLRGAELRDPTQVT